MRLPEDVLALVDSLLADPGPGREVAFDADGTLWRGDIGEDLLRYLAASDLLPGLEGRRGIYAEYERRVGRDPADAYAYAVEVMAGMEEARLADTCRDFFHSRFEGRLFPWVRGLFAHLQGRGWRPWIVSASPLWPVRAGALALEVPPERVVGVRCGIRDGRLDGAVARPVPCGEGKVHWLRAAGVRPRLAFGNGDLDLPMLAYAQRAVAVAPPREETALTREARARGWPILRC